MLTTCFHTWPQALLPVLQVYELSTQFLPKEWIMEKWEDGFYITAMAGSTSGSSLVVMSKGTPYTQQSYKVASLMPANAMQGSWWQLVLLSSTCVAGSRRYGPLGLGGSCGSAVQALPLLSS